MKNLDLDFMVSSILANYPDLEQDLSKATEILNEIYETSYDECEIEERYHKNTSFSQKPFNEEKL